MKEGHDNSFGEHLKTLRLQAGFGLRKFASQIEMPASNLSAIEHGRRQMPEEKVELVAQVIGLEKGSSNRERFFDLAAQTGKLPIDVQEIAARGFVPALLRTIDNRNLSDDEVKRLIDDLRGKDVTTQTESS